MASATAAHVGRARLREHALRCDDESGASLARRGLVGGVAGTFGDELRCIVPRTVLVRVRATFREPVAEEPNKAGGFITASGRIITGQIAVRTLGGRQIAYADVTDSGRARMFSRGCL